MNGIKLRGTGRCVPANTVTNDDLSRLVDTNDEWITERTGIKERHHRFRASPASGFLLSEKDYFNRIILLQAFKADEHSVLVIGSQILKSPVLGRITEYDFPGLHRLEIL